MSEQDGAASLVRSDALLGCPFCGRHSPGPASGTYMIAAKDGQAVRCPTCNAHGPLCPTFDQAIAQWNHRKPNASVSITGDEPGYAPRECSGWPCPCPHCSAELMFDADRGVHCDGCDDLTAEDIDAICVRFDFGTNA